MTVISGGHRVLLEVQRSGGGGEISSAVKLSVQQAVQL